MREGVAASKQSAFQEGLDVVAAESKASDVIAKTQGALALDQPTGPTCEECYPALAIQIESSLFLLSEIMYA